MKRLVQCFFVFVAGLVTLGLQAQTSSSIIGQTTDQQGTPLVNAGLFVLQAQDSSLVSLGISGQDGHFKIESIKPGLYRLRYTLDGYQTIYSDPIRISQGRPIVDMGIRQLKRKKAQPSSKPVVARRAKA